MLLNKYIIYNYFFNKENMETLGLYARSSVNEIDLKLQIDSLRNYPDYGKYKVLEFFEQRGISNLLVKRFALPNDFIEHGSRSAFFDRYGL